MLIPGLERGSVCKTRGIVFSDAVVEMEIRKKEKKGGGDAMKGNLWKILGIAIVLVALPNSASMAENRHSVGFGLDVATVDSDLFFNEEDHVGFSIFGKIGFSDHWGLFLFYRDMEDDEDFFGLEQTYQQIGAHAVYMWRPNKKVRPHVGFGLVRTDFEADFSGFVVSDDGVGASVSGGVEVGSQRVAFYAEYQITVVDLDDFDPDSTTIDDLLAGIIFKF